MQLVKSYREYAALLYRQQVYRYTAYPAQTEAKLSEFLAMVDGGKSQGMTGRNHWQNNLLSKA